MNRDISNNSDVFYRTLFNHLNNLVSGNSHSSEQIINNVPNVLQNPNIDYFNILNTNPQQLNSVYGNFLENFVTNQINFPNSENQINTLLQETLQQSNNYKYVLSEKGRKEICEERYSAEKYPDQKSCPISQKKFTENK